MTLPREYVNGFRRIENPPRTWLRINEHQDKTLPGIGPEVEAALIEAREREVRG